MDPLPSCGRCGQPGPQTPCRACWVAEAMDAVADWQAAEDAAAREEAETRLGLAILGMVAA